MIEGTLIAASLRVGTVLEDLELTVRKISRYRAGGTTPDQPEIWTTLDFQAKETQAEVLARTFSGALDQPGWYVNFESPAENFVVFPAGASATRAATCPAGPQPRRTGASSPFRSRSWTGRCEPYRR